MGAEKLDYSGSIAELLMKGHYRLFTGLELEDFSLLAPAFKSKSFVEDEEMLRIGEESFDIFFIASGNVKVEIPLISGNGRERIAAFGSGNTVGEFALVRTGKVTAQVSTISRTEALATNRERLQELLLRHPELGTRVYRNLSSILVDRLVDTNLLARNVLSQISLF